MLSTCIVNRRLLLRLLATIFATAALLAIGGTPRASAGSGPAQNCMAPPDAPDRSTPVIAVLSGITKVDNGANVAAVRRAALEKVVAAGFKTKARLLVDTIGSGASDADLAVNTQLVATGPNDLFRHANQTCKQNGVKAATSGLLERHMSGPVDVLGALQVLQGHLTGLTKQPVQLVLLSSMLNGTQPLVLNNHALTEPPDSLIARVRHADLMPNCINWRVYIIGAGQTADGGVSDTLNARLKDFWSSFFRACGGQLVLYDTALTQFPVQPQHVVMQTHRRNLLVVTLPASVLFDSGRWNLRRGSAGALIQLLGIVRRYPSGAITVSGYTDATPYHGPGGNVGLSKRRAGAVVAWLQRRGVMGTRLHAVGHGAADPVASNKTAVGRQANRRVEVTLVASR